MKFFIFIIFFFMYFFSSAQREEAILNHRNNSAEFISYYLNNKKGFLSYTGELKYVDFDKSIHYFEETKIIHVITNEIESEFFFGFKFDLDNIKGVDFNYFYTDDDIDNIIISTDIEFKNEISVESNKKLKNELPEFKKHKVQGVSILNQKGLSVDDAKKYLLAFKILIANNNN